MNFLKPRIKILGHYVSSNGLEADPEKTRAVVEISTPQNTKQLADFIGSANYFRKFIDHYADRFHPLSKLMKKGVKYEWTEQQQ